MSTSDCIPISSKFPNIQFAIIIQSLGSLWTMRNTVWNYNISHAHHFSHNIWKCTKGHDWPAKIQISLHTCTVWSESSLGAFWIVKDTKFLHAGNKYSEQTAQMYRLVWVYIGRTCQKLCFLTIRLSYSLSITSSLIWLNLTLVMLNKLRCCAYF